MKRVWIVSIMVMGLAACNNRESIKINVDSVGKKFDSSAQRLWDSTKEKGKELKGKIKDKMEQRDSAR